ncbi:hypothetical protein C9F11_44770 (plasmid) [Streptomyces sp. YIM 121038]|nr:hypothetical protein C9F11_44770 [Streptomyces sp. YIM 121038]
MFAYYCAKCKSEQTDPRLAEQFAKTLGLNLWKPKDEVSYDYPTGALACRAAIDQAACVICQPPIGNDCSWELGYAMGTGKKVYILGALEIDDWMTKIGLLRVNVSTGTISEYWEEADSVS